MTIAAAFQPHEKLATRLLAELDAQTSDGSHDLSHTLRVWRNAARIADGEGGCDLELLVAAVILHDCVAVEKNSPLRSQASRLAASRAVEICAPLGFSGARLDGLAHAIATHSFSAGLPAKTLEARILQDADRLDAIGAIGIARCFYVAGRLGAALYDQGDPTARNRSPTDAAFALDHFDAKLFKITGSFQTASGAALASARDDRMRIFIADLLAEIGGET